MERKPLLSKRALFAALFVLLLSLAGTKKALAQNNVATLQHGNDISTFYGEYAYRNAYDSAAVGDIITLSSGRFRSVENVNKVITLRGAGCTYDAASDTYPTVIFNTTTFDTPEATTSFAIEGIWFEGDVYCKAIVAPSFVKCNFNCLRSNDNNKLTTDALFVNCMVRSIGSYKGFRGVQFINSFVRDHYDMSDLTQASFVNCIWDVYGNANVPSVRAKNCILWGCGESNTSQFEYCIGNGNVFVNQQNSTNWKVDNLNEVFNTLTGFECCNNSFFTADYTLLQSVIEGHPGHDGTQVGVFGGLAPYNPRPSYMVVQSCNVANQSTQDNKLSVEIQVVGQGE